MKSSSFLFLFLTPSLLLGQSNSSPETKPLPQQKTENSLPNQPQNSNFLVANSKPLSQTLPANSISEKKESHRPIPFTFPNTSPKIRPLFVRHKIALDKDNQAHLAECLAGLTGYSLKTPENLQNHARIFAFMSTIAPDSGSAYKIYRLLRKSNLPAPDPTKFARSRDAVWQYFRWLNSPEAGQESQVAAQHLLDIMIDIDPSNPLAQNFNSQSIKTRWNGIVAPIEKFGGTPEPAPSPTPSVAEADPFADTPTTPTTPEVVEQLVFKEPKQIISYPGFTTNENREYVQTKITLNGAAVGVSPASTTPTEILMTPVPVGHTLSIGISNLKQYTTIRWGKQWPNGGSFSLNSTVSLADVQSNAEHIGFPIAMALEASFLGKKVPENTRCIGFLQADGKLLPSRFWWKGFRFIQRENQQKPSFILLAKGMSEDIKNILVSNTADFFLSNHIAEFDAAQAAASWMFEPSAQQKEANTSFEEIQKLYFTRKMPANSIPANKTIRDRLTKIVELDPSNISAQMLLIHGGEPKFRPKKYSLRIMAMELETALAPVSTLISKNIGTQKDDILTQTYDDLRKNIDVLKGITPSKAENILKKLTELAYATRNLASCIRQTTSGKAGDRASIRQQQAQKYAAEITDMEREIKTWIQQNQNEKN